MIAGWTAEEYAKCPEVIDRLHRRILDLQDAAGAVLDSYFNDDPDERKKVVVYLERLDDVLYAGEAA